MVDRTNPIGLVRAFQTAFADRTDVALLLKIGFGLRPDAARVLLELLAAHGLRRTPTIHLVADPLASTTLDAVYRRADAFVSLHRAEGFGSCIAEAMAYARPVVATRWSASLELTDDDAAFLVDADLVPIRQAPSSHAPFDEAPMNWAEPRLDDAAEALRACVARSGEHARKAARGRQIVRERLDPGAIGRQMAARVRALGR